MMDIVGTRLVMLFHEVIKIILSSDRRFLIHQQRMYGSMPLRRSFVRLIEPHIFQGKLQLNRFSP